MLGDEAGHGSDASAPKFESIASPGAAWSVPTPVEEFVRRLRGAELPRLVYLANCHGVDPAHRRTSAHDARATGDRDADERMVAPALLSSARSTNWMFKGVRLPTHTWRNSCGVRSCRFSGYQRPR